ncbi:MAG: hypothetical protein C5B54_12420 [Acidobacteria bacterium]|nr:MAG: hypothetical protein C5B54_12420 [Acidobacteriota bacterium]
MDDIVIERIYPFSPEQIWDALTDPSALADWLMPGDFKPVVGHHLQFQCEPGHEYDGTVDVIILKVEKARLLSYSWKTSNMQKPTTVTFSLTPTSGGTLLRLEHRGFEGDSGKVMHPIFKNGWGEKLTTQLGPAIERLVKSKMN